MAAHSSVLAWRIPGTGDRGGLLSVGSHRVGHDWSDLAANIIKWKCQSLSHVWFFATPQSVAYQASLSMEFSGQKYWNGLPCPSLGNLPNPGIEPRYPTLQADSLLSELPGNPKNTGMGSLSLLQYIFPTRGSNRSPLHHRQILYQLNYQGYMHIYHWITVLYIYIYMCMYTYIYVCILETCTTL